MLVVLTMYIPSTASRLLPESIGDPLRGWLLPRRRWADFRQGHEECPPNPIGQAIPPYLRHHRHCSFDIRFDWCFDRKAAGLGWPFRFGTGIDWSIIGIWSYWEVGLIDCLYVIIIHLAFNLLTNQPPARAAQPFTYLLRWDAQPA